MQRVIDYTVAEDEASIKALIREGWQPYGDSCRISKDISHDYRFPIYVSNLHQPMVKYAKPVKRKPKASKKEANR